MMEPAQLNGFAVDLGGTKTAVARISGGKIEDRKIMRTDGRAAPDEFVEALANMLSKIGYQRGNTLGVAVTGRVDTSGVWHAVNQATLTGVTGIPIAQNITEAIGPATVLNDAAAATLAEVHMGSGKGRQHFGYLTVSTGVGGGLFLGGRLHQSRNGLAGHIGFVSSPQGREMCGSGRRGTVESVASGNAIALAAHNAGHPGLDARDVFERARKGDKWADELFDNSAQAIAELCADLTVSLGLEAIALGGSVGLAEGYLERIKVHIAQLPRLFQPTLSHSQLGHDGPLLGALLMTGIDG